MKRYCLETLTIARRVLLEMRRARSRLLFWVVFPSLMLLLFGLIYAGDEAPAKSFNAVAPGILVGAALFFSCLGGPVSVIVGERERMTLRRLLYSPLRPVSYFFGNCPCALCGWVGARPCRLRNRLGVWWAFSGVLDAGASDPPVLRLFLRRTGVLFWCGNGDPNRRCQWTDCGLWSPSAGLGRDLLSG